MKNALALHFTAIQATITSLLKGKFVLFFVPGVIISIGYWFLWYQGQAYRSFVAETEEISLIGGALAWFLGLVGDLLGFLVDQFYKFLLLVCLSPVMCLLSERFDNHLTGHHFNGGLIRILNDLLRAVIVVFLAVIMHYFFLACWAVFSWILSFIFPFMEYLDPIAYFIITSFFIGFSFYDYSMERYQKGVMSSFSFGFKHKSYVFLTGALFSSLYYLPIIGIIIAPVLVTMIATAVYIYVIQPKLNKEQVISA
jgi:CysZ protein